MAKEKKIKLVEGEIKKHEVIALKNFAIHWNDFHRDIKKGDDCSDIPEQFIQNLKTEGVLK